MKRLKNFSCERSKLGIEFDAEINNLVEKAINELHAPKTFIAGESSIPVTGKVFGKPEISAAVSASLDFWLTAGPYTEKFESDFAKKVGMRHSFMVNSGSSANLLALSSLLSPRPVLKSPLDSYSNARTTIQRPGRIFKSQGVYSRVRQYFQLPGSRPERFPLARTSIQTLGRH